MSFRSKKIVCLFLALASVASASACAGEERGAPQVDESRLSKSDFVDSQPCDDTFDAFREEWERQYRQEAASLDLFGDRPSRWTDEQKAYFAKLFYHARGHFSDFLWYVANHTSDVKVKQIVIANVTEELGGKGASHEQMYIQFGCCLGADLRDEYGPSPKTYLPFLREFNQGHVRYLHEHEETARLAAFGAYERLDNVDYPNLQRLAQNLGVSGADLQFFDVHVDVTHFSATEPKLQKAWRSHKDDIIDAFVFIGSHQLQLWRDLYEHVQAYPGTK